LTSFSGRNKSSRWLLWLTLVIAALLIVLLIRFGYQNYGDDAQQTSSESVRQASRGKAEPASSTDDSGAGIPESSPAPFPNRSASRGDDSAIPVTFKGVVLNEAGRSPIGGARVKILALSSSSETMEKTTGEDGTFTIDAPPAYRYELNVEAEGFNSFRNDSFVITRPDYSIEILLNRAFALKGRVLDMQSNGIPGAMVGIFGERGDGPFMSNPTDAQGAFAISSVPRGGRVQLDAYHAGFDSLGMVNARMPSEEEIILRMKPAIPAGSLGGLVKDSGLQPISGAKISIMDATGTRKASEVQTDQKGEYRLSRIREGSFLVQCAADGFSSDNYQATATISAGKETRLDFSMKTGKQIRGVVVNQKGEPVANATLSYRIGSIQRGGRNMRGDGVINFASQVISSIMGLPGSSMGGSVTTDAKGVFQIMGLMDGNYQVSVQHRDYLDFSAMLQPSSQPQTLTLDSALSLRGAASNLQGVAIEKFDLAFQSTTKGFSKTYSFTTSDGHFEVRGLTRDKYTIILRVSNRENYMGTLDLQSSMQVFLMTGEKPDTGSATRSGRSDGRGGAAGRSAESGQGGPPSRGGDFGQGGPPGRGGDFGQGGDPGRGGFPGQGGDFGPGGGRGRGGNFGTLTIINAK
jgi:hypothetical protein